MSGLAFPAGPAFHRPEPYNQGSPYTSGDDIPIDPALSGPQVDPALLGEGESLATVEGYPPPFPFQQLPIPQPRQYSQGPQGDPFAPQPLPAYLPVEEPAPPPSKPVRKKRAPRREEECGFCQGDDSKNKQGVPEPMVTCAECGRSGHPSCLQLAEIGDIIRSYGWKCNDCKNCEICHQKGGENRLLFCDFCDRGWHMDCLQPPILEAPEGKWHCPLCPPLPPPGYQLPPPLPPGMNYPVEQSLQLQTPFRESSVASSSRIVGNGLPETIPATDESDVDVEGGDTPTTNKQRSKKKSRSKGKAPMRSQTDEADATTAPVRTVKRMRLRLSSPAPPPPPPPKTLPVIRLRLPPRGKGKGREEDPDDGAKGIFDDVLSAEDRDTSATTINNGDKQRFERSRVAVEEKLLPRPPAPEASETAGAGPSTRPLRSAVHHHLVPAPVHEPERSESPTPSTPGPSSKPANGPRIRRIRFGEYDIDTWYDAPFPEEYANIPDGRLWICEFCLKYMKSHFGAGRHQMKCKMRHPPGDEIYRDGSISIFEVDGRRNKIYCQNLCLLSKMFLDHKSLFYDVEPFLFYVITEVDDVGARFVGYFSKEKRSPKDYNISCIMTLPVRQRQGWGHLLIDFSYLLSKKEQRAGSPEKPLSPLGALGYKSYWTLSLMRYLQTAPPPSNLRLEDISTATAMTIEDIHSTLVQLNMITVNEVARPKPLPGQTIRFPKGRKNGVARKHLQRTQTQDDEKVKGPFMPPTKYEIHWDPAEVEQYLLKWEAKGYLRLRPEKLKWSPFIVARTRKSEQLPSGEAENGQPGDKLEHRTKAGLDTTPVPDTAPATPRPDKTVGARAISVSNTKSPAFSLFDDDVAVTPASKETPSRVLPETVLARSPSVIPEQNETAQLEQDRALAEKLAKEVAMSNRRLRSRDLSDTTAETRPTSRETPRTARKLRPSGGRTISSPAVTTKGTSVDGHTSVSTNGDDAAFAAKLALEERRMRQLRSRSNTAQEGKRAISSPSSVSPRKRRRVEEQPDAESELTPLPARRSTRHLTEKDYTPTKGINHQRNPSRLANGTASMNVRPLPLPPATSSIADSSSAALTDGSGERGEVSRAEALNGAVPHRGMQEQNGLAEGRTEDMKYEDVDTPLTTMTSRHSVPSDDTVVVAEDNAGGRSKVSPVGEAVDIETEASTVRQEGGAMDATELDEFGDEDAEGEDDIDAEGEPDVEETDYAVA
ncbi:hypothetical protein AcV5_008515 [Taiwanofungus camphoratus]|nr:hypothetical protein AcV5_008515 [Antrodia cinnamomea]